MKGAEGAIQAGGNTWLERCRSASRIMVGGAAGRRRMHSRSQNFLQLLSAVSGNKGMRTNTHTRALAVYLIALSLCALTLSLLAEDTHSPVEDITSASSKRSIGH